MFISGGIVRKNNLQKESSRDVLNSAVYKLNLKSRRWEHFWIKSLKVDHLSTIIGDKMCLVGGFNGSCSADTEIIPIRKKDKILNFTIPLMHSRRSSFGMWSFGECIL